MNWRRFALCVYVAALMVGCVLLARAWQVERRRCRLAAQGTLIAEIASLNALREGRITDAIGRLEMHAYAVGVGFIRSTAAESNVTRQVIVEQILDYRRRCAQPPSEWAPVECELERVLK